MVTRTSVLALFLASVPLASAGSDETGPVLKHKLDAYLPRPNQRVGRQVALSAGTLAAAAQASNGGIGAVHVYERAGSTWLHRQEIVSPEPTGGANFGKDLALEGDLLVASVSGTPLTKEAVFVFDRQSGQWSQTAMLQNPLGPAHGDHFGRALALSDGLLVIGAPRADAAAPDGGAVFVLERLGGVWTLLSVIAQDVEAGDQFGYSVAIDGDLLVVGAPFEHAEGVKTGVVHVFRRSARATWSEIGRLRSHDAAAQDGFGSSVAIDGTRIVVGAPSATREKYSVGRVYVFDQRSNSTYMQVDAFGPPAADVEAQQNFGFDVGVFGDEIVVGAPAFSLCPTARGYVYVPGGGDDDDGGGDGDGNGDGDGPGDWQPDRRFVPDTDGVVVTGFGRSVAYDGQDLVYGAPGDEPNGAYAEGAVYVWSQVEVDDGSGATPAGPNAAGTGQGATSSATGPGVSDPGRTSCHGDGAGLPCPCGNQSPSPDEGCAHSGGSGMTIYGRGTASIGSGDLTLVVENVPPENVGLFVVGTALVPAGSTGFDGLLCVGGEVMRFDMGYRSGSRVSDSSCLAGGADGYFATGATYTFQYFSRDARAQSPCGGSGNFSPAYTVTLAP